jgi:hypothetical protein
LSNKLSQTNYLDATCNGFYRKGVWSPFGRCGGNYIRWNGAEISIQSYLLFLFKNNKAITILRRDENSYGKRINSDINVFFESIDLISFL